MRTYLWQTDGSLAGQDLAGERLVGPCPSLLVDEERFADLRARAPSPPQVSFLGSGDYHFLSFFLLEKVREPFTLLLLDRHSDAQESAFGLLSCGSWVRWAVQLPFLQEVRLWGPDPTSAVNLPARCRLFPFDAPAEALWAGELPFYLSIDKDLLAPDILPLGWEQGEIREERLYGILAARQRLLGADICGEPPVDPGSFSLEAEDARRVSERINRRILALLSTS